MQLFGYGCPDCGAYASSVDGHRRADGALSIRCPACGEIDVVRRYRETLGEVAR